MDLILYGFFLDGTVLSINVLSICNDSQISDRYYFNCSVVALATSFALVYFIMCGRSETIIYFFIALILALKIENCPYSLNHSFTEKIICISGVSY